MEVGKPRYIEELAEWYTECLKIAEQKVNEQYPNLAATDKRKMIKQTARAVLPNATETKIMVTGNARTWRHFLNMRATVYADAEIRQMALNILDILQIESPIIFGDYEKENRC
jgi:thymidylate synthase (FAD)